ncbi:unnamed protein product [Diatraea saccharalis]|uniref:Uncharacterized protein n=1 Tax=Diatraea saccharalis TaxID=40085 RepID=A0A9N9RGJ1_9NEOP|nr:unnamed protein product [Diatraea saccharalis]
MAQTINVLIDNQKKMFHKLASLSVQIEYEFSKCDNTKNTDVVALGKSSNPIENEAFVIKPIDSVKELEELESRLSDKQQKIQLLKQYSFICLQSDGKVNDAANETVNTNEDYTNERKEQEEEVIVDVAANETVNTNEDYTNERKEQEEEEEEE